MTRPNVGCYLRLRKDGEKLGLRQSVENACQYQHTQTAAKLYVRYHCTGLGVQFLH